MESIKWPFLLLAFLTIAGLVGVGIGIGESSPLIITISITVSLASVATGFTLRKKINEQEQG